jgi:uncharacterized protein (TIGR02246 family)
VTEADKVLRELCERYSAAVNASDATTYARLFTKDAIRMPPGSLPEYGREMIQQGEQADYDVAKWNVAFRPENVLEIADDWLYGIANVEVKRVNHADGATSDVALTVTWLLNQQPSGEWLIKRQMWNRKPNPA